MTKGLPGNVEHQIVGKEDFAECDFRHHAGLSSPWAPAVGAVTLVALFVVDEVYQKVVVSAVIWYALALLYFGLYARHHLVDSPEEVFAAKIRGEVILNPEVRS